MRRIGIGLGVGLLVALLATQVLGDALHTPFDALLQRYVDGDGRVAYRTLQERDSAAAGGSVAAFVRRYQPVPDTARIEYLDYDWTMHAQPAQRPD